jgi:hypothetical protein
MSAPTPVFTGRFTEQGCFSPDCPEDWRRYRLTLAGQRVEVVARKARAKRSPNQNDYWHAVPVRLLAAHLGYSEKEMSDALLGECFGWKPGPAGREIPIKESTTKLSVEEMGQLMEWTPRWALEFHSFRVPLPNECDYGSEDAA